MASHSDHGEITYTIADGNDYQAHEHTYESFIKVVKIFTSVVVFILIMMAIFLT